MTKFLAKNTLKRGVEGMNIKNKSGDVIGKIQFQTSEEGGMVHQIIMDLKPGDGKGIYISNAEDNKFSQQTSYAARDWEGDFGALREKLHPWQPRFPTCSVVQDIKVFHGFDNLSDQEINEMIEESERTGSNVVIRDLKPNHVITGINITYQSDRGVFKLHVFGTTKSRIHVPDTESFKIEKLDLRGHEAYYISNAENRQLIWIEEDAGGKALQYEIVGSDMSQEWVLNIAESMIE